MTTMIDDVGNNELLMLAAQKFLGIICCRPLPWYNATCYVVYVYIYILIGRGTVDRRRPLILSTSKVK